MNTNVDDDDIRENLARFLVYYGCPSIKCYVATTVTFASEESFSFWYKEITKYFGPYISFIFEQIQMSEKGTPIFNHYYNPNYIKNYPKKLEQEYDNLIKTYKKMNQEDLLDDFSKFLAKT